MQYRHIDNLVANEDTDPVRVAQYKRLIHAGQPIPPLLVKPLPDGKFLVEDGRYRLAALTQLGQWFAPTVNQATMSPEQHEAYNNASRQLLNGYMPRRFPKNRST